MISFFVEWWHTLRGIVTKETTDDPNNVGNITDWECRSSSVAVSLPRWFEYFNPNREERGQVVSTSEHIRIPSNESDQLDT